MAAFAVLLAYDGAGRSWTGGPNSVDAVLVQACRRLGEIDIQIDGASRTDAGVHAWGQVAHVKLKRSWTTQDFVNALAHHMPSGVLVRAAAGVPENWALATSVLEKTYRYRLDVGAVPAWDGRRGMAWRCDSALDWQVLEWAANQIPGVRDWKAFVRRGDQRHDPEWRGSIRRAIWRRRHQWADFTCVGTAFRYRLMRSLVGGMVAVASGRACRNDWNDVLTGHKNGVARQQAPAHGLTLRRVRLAMPMDWHFPARHAAFGVVS